MPPESSQLELRLVHLERTVRLQRFGMLALLAGGVALLASSFMSQSGSDEVIKTLRVHRLEVIGTQIEGSGEHAVAKHVPVIVLDASGGLTAERIEVVGPFAEGNGESPSSVMKPMVVLDGDIGPASDSMGRVQIYDGLGRARVVLGAAAHGMRAPQLEMRQDDSSAFAFVRPGLLSLSDHATGAEVLLMTDLIGGGISLSGSRDEAGKQGATGVRLSAFSEPGGKFQGGSVSVFNKTGEQIATMRSDDSGEGVIGAWDRYGKGRTLTPRDK